MHICNFTASYISTLEPFLKNRQYYKFCSYGFLKNLRFFDAFFILFLVEKGVSFTQIGVLYAVREIVTHILELPSGIIADSLGRKSSLAASLLIYILTFALFFLFDDFWIFLIAMGLFGAGEAFRTGTHKGMIMDYLKLMGWEKHAGNYYGHTRSWSQKGSAISALLSAIRADFLEAREVARSNCIFRRSLQGGLSLLHCTLSVELHPDPELPRETQPFAF